MVRFLFKSLLGLAIALFPAGCSQQEKPAGEAFKEPVDPLPVILDHDFRKTPAADDQALPETIHFENVKDEAQAQFEPQGLHFKVPKTLHIKRGTGVGLDTYFGLRGDFDITATFDSFRADAPKDGPGVGFGLSCQTKGAGSVQIARVVRAGDEQLVRWNWWPGQKGKPVEGGTSPATESAGRLRLKRTGATLSFLWVPGTQGGDFQKMYQCELGTFDIYYARINAFTFGLPADVEARLIDWRIRGQREDNPVFDPAKAPTPEMPKASSTPPPRGHLAAAVIIGTVLLLSMGLGTWLLVRRRSRASTPRTTEDEGNEARPESIVFACPSCEKKLKVKMEFAGKKIKCPKCGQEVAVPQRLVCRKDN